MAEHATYCTGVDDSWKVHASTCRGGFDFTLLFEEVVLCILPIVLAIAISPFRIYGLLRTTSKIEPSKRPIYKAVCLGSDYIPLHRCPILTSSVEQAAWILWSALQFLQAVLWALPDARRTRLSFASNLIMGCGSIILCVLSYIEHSRSVRPAFLLELYLLVTLPFDAARARTLWLRDGGDVDKLMAIVASFAVGVKVMLVLLESWQKKAILKNKYKNYPAEARAGLANRAFFWWLNPLFLTGFRKTLQVEDLYTLDKRLESPRLRDLLGSRWSKGW